MATEIFFTGLMVLCLGLLGVLVAPKDTSAVPIWWKVITVCLMAVGILTAFAGTIIGIWS